MDTWRLLEWEYQVMRGRYEGDVGGNMGETAKFKGHLRGSMET